MELYTGWASWWVSNLTKVYCDRCGNERDSKLKLSVIDTFMAKRTGYDNASDRAKYYVSVDLCRSCMDCIFDIIRDNLSVS